MNIFYNEEVKNRYLNESNFSEDTKSVIASLFEKTRTTEIFYGDDLYSFTLSQIDKVMKLMSSSTYNSALNNKSRLNRYISWAIENGLRKSNINPLQGTTDEWTEQYVDRVSKRYLSEIEINDIIEELDSYQDKALVRAIFEGISGVGFSELLSMRISNIHNDKIQVKNKNKSEPRMVSISNKLKKLLYKAYEETEYFYPIGDSVTELTENEDRILKATVWKNSKNNELKAHNITRRMSNIKERFDLEEFSVKTVLDSGKIKMAYEIIKKSRKRLEKEDYGLIGDQYDMNKITNDGYSYHNISIIKRVVNDINLLELYGVDDEFYSI